MTDRERIINRVRKLLEFDGDSATEGVRISWSISSIKEPE